LKYVTGDKRLLGSAGQEDHVRSERAYLLTERVWGAGSRWKQRRLDSLCYQMHLRCGM